MTFCQRIAVIAKRYNEMIWQVFDGWNARSHIFCFFLFYDYFLDYKENIHVFKWPILKILVFLQVNPVNSTLFGKTKTESIGSKSHIT